MCVQVCVCSFLPWADFFADVSQVIELCHILRCADITVRSDRCCQLPEARCRRLHQPLARTNHKPVLLRPVSLLVVSGLFSLLVTVQYVAKGVLDFGQCLRRTLVFTAVNE